MKNRVSIIVGGEMEVMVKESSFFLLLSHATTKLCSECTDCYFCTCKCHHTLMPRDGHWVHHSEGYVNWSQVSCLPEDFPFLMYTNQWIWSLVEIVSSLFFIFLIPGFILIFTLFCQGCKMINVCVFGLLPLLTNKGI